MEQPFYIWHGHGAPFWYVDYPQKGLLTLKLFCRELP